MNWESLVLTCIYGEEKQILCSITASPEILKTGAVSLFHPHQFCLHDTKPSEINVCFILTTLTSFGLEIST